MRYFFLSYAHSDYDGFVAKFFDDLSADVRTCAGLSPGEDVGFLDQASLQIGDQWQPTLVDWLQTCRTFVALASPRYFSSAPCGKEWWVFSQRLTRMPSHQPMSALIPLIWVPVDEVPTCLADLQYRDRSFGRGYDEGLQMLMALEGSHDEYWRLIRSVARRIVTVGKPSAPPALDPAPTYGSAVNAFATEESPSDAAPMPRLILGSIDPDTSAKRPDVRQQPVSNTLPRVFLHGES